MLKKAEMLFLTASLCLFTAGSLAAQTKILYPEVELEKKGPVLGVLVSGGSLTASSANTLGGLGHFSLGLSGSLSNPSFKGSPRGAKVSSGSAAAVLRAGILEGATLGPGLHGLGSLDLYLRLGNLATNGWEEDNAVFWGVGTRIGILRNSILSPAVSLSAGYHRTSELSLAEVIYGPLPGPKDVGISTWSVRCDVSKNFFFLTPIAGVGFNHNRFKSPPGAAPAGTNPAKVYFNPAGFTVSTTDLVYYAALEWNLFLLRLGLELGRTGGDTFGSLNIRLAL
ncbi:MAG: hypothetical protein JXQ83_01815 [Candidatus Glassbacteria bacterium]|nr:hypothetical protein [Candidatus Glassbacteria bacterium]